MKVILYGATGMIGQAVLRECLLASDVERVLAVGRHATRRQHEKLSELVLDDLTSYAGHDEALKGYDACFYCLGASSAGMSEADYRRVTYDFALAAATALARVNPGMTFVFVSGAGTDSTGTGRAMWARVKGETENAIAKLPFKATYMFRPAYIQPMHGARSRTAAYRVLYAVMAPLFPLWKALSPKHVTTSENVGKAMLNVAKHGAPKQILENDDINIAAGASA